MKKKKEKEIKKKKKKKRRTKKELFDCYKNCRVTKAIIEKHMIKISEQLNDLFQKFVVTK